MKKILLFLMLPALLFSCKGDNVGDFEVLITPDRFEFESVPGGALMTFELSEEHSEVYQIEAVYANNQGRQIIKNAYVLSGELLLDGMISAGNVPVTVYLKNNKNERSEPLNLNFTALESFPSLVLKDDNLDVKPYWGGFRIVIDEELELTEKTTGQIRVSYRGISSFTGQLADIQIGVININDNAYSTRFSPDASIWQDGQITVVLQSEDLDANIIARREYQTTQLTGAAVAEDVIMHSSSIARSVETSDYSWKALFDGAKNYKGADYMAFLSVDDSKQSEWIFDLGVGGAIPAYLRIYTQYWIADEGYFPAPYTLPAILLSDASPYAYLEGLSVRERLPHAVEVYGTNDVNGTWVKIGSYATEGGRLAFEGTWCQAASSAADFSIQSSERVGISAGNYEGNAIEENLENVYLEVDFPGFESTNFRYIRINILDTFSTFGYFENLSESPIDYNVSGQVSFSELEIYVNN